MKKYRIVEFQNGKFAIQKLLFGFIPTDRFVDVKASNSYRIYLLDSAFLVLNSCCGTLEEIKAVYHKIHEPHPLEVKQEVKVTEIEKILKGNKYD